MTGPAAVTALTLALLLLAAGAVLLVLVRRSRQVRAELARAEERLRQTEGERQAARTRLDTVRRVLDTLEEAVMVVDGELRISDVNRAALSLLELGGATLGRPLLEAIRNPELEKAVRSARAEGRSVERELVALSSEGERRLLQVLAVPLGEEEPARVVVVLRDLTRVRHLETVRRDFVAALSHEIQTPLTAIRGYAETLAQTNVPSGDRDRYLSVILRNTGRLERLLEDLRLLSRAESGELPLSPAPVDLGEVCRSLLEDLEVRLREAGLSARVENDGRAVARADRRALDHVLLNLLDNAIKYTPSGGRITVRIGMAADAATVEVTDTGIGIPSGDLGRVFERLYRVDRARSRDAGGTGLGLAIVRHLLEGMGGSITVESELERGSTFRVNLPAVSDPG